MLSCRSVSYCRSVAYVLLSAAVLHVLPVDTACMRVDGSSMVILSAHGISEGVQGYC
jgi:hypothetical protein